MRYVNICRHSDSAKNVTYVFPVPSKGVEISFPDKELHKARILGVEPGSQAWEMPPHYIRNKRRSRCSGVALEPLNTINEDLIDPHGRKERGIFLLFVRTGPERAEAL